MSTAASFLNLAAAALTRDLPAALGPAGGGLRAARATTVASLALAAAGLGAASERTVALLGVAGWGFFTAAFLPVFTVGLAWPRARRAAPSRRAMVAGAAVDLALEVVRSRLPPASSPASPAPPSACSSSWSCPRS